jgi:hypothetical protein
MEIGTVIECEVEFARSRGRCREGCGFAQLIDHPRAGVVCRWTMQTCKVIELAEVYELYSLLNADEPTGKGFFNNEQGKQISFDSEPGERSEVPDSSREEGRFDQFRQDDQASP